MWSLRLCNFSNAAQKSIGWFIVIDYVDYIEEVQLFHTWFKHLQTHEIDIRFSANGIQ